MPASDPRNALHRLAKQQTDLAQTQALLDFVGDKYLEYSDRITELERQQKILAIA